MGKLYIGSTFIDVVSKLKIGSSNVQKMYIGSTLIFPSSTTPTGSIDTSFNIGTGFNERVYSTKIDSNGKIIASGVFTTYSGSTQNYLVRLNSDGTKDTSFNIGTGFNNIVDGLAVDSNGKIIAGGIFSAYSGSSHNGFLIRLNTDGTKDTTFNIGS